MSQLPYVLRHVSTGFPVSPAGHVRLSTAVHRKDHALLDTSLLTRLLQARYVFHWLIMTQLPVPCRGSEHRRSGDVNRLCCFTCGECGFTVTSHALSLPPVAANTGWLELSVLIFRFRLGRLHVYVSLTLTLTNPN